MAYQLLHKTSLKEALSQDMEDRLLRLGVRADRILEEVARVAFSDIRRLFNADGSFKLPTAWDAETAAAVEEFSCKGDGRRVIGHRVRLHDKVKALELLGRYLKLFPTGNRGGNVEVHVREAKPAHSPTPELAAKIRKFLTIADARMKQKQLEDKSCNPQRPAK